MIVWGQYSLKFHSVEGLTIQVKIATIYCPSCDRITIQTPHSIGPQLGPKRIRIIIFQSEKQPKSLPLLL